jgi:uncharacterized protein (TIGR01777 family)
MSDRVLITGASGFVGRALSRHLVEMGLDVVALSRRPSRAREVLGSKVEVAEWDGVTCGAWADLADGALGIVNLAGENIGAGRWTKKKKRRIIESRVNTCKAIVAAVAQSKNKANVIVQASGVGYYGDRGADVLVESSSLGTGFLADVARQWEASVEPAADMGVRVAVIRLGGVLGPGGGLLSSVLPAFRMFLGGWAGSGKQWFSWVHIEDVVSAIRFLIEHSDLYGAFNLVSPNPVVSKEFYKVLGAVMHRPVLFGGPGFMLKLVLGEMATELLLSGQRAVPEKLLAAGYRFKYSDAKWALEKIVGKASQ